MPIYCGCTIVMSNHYIITKSTTISISIIAIVFILYIGIIIWIYNCSGFYCNYIYCSYSTSTW